jgi:hypothetical protein
MRVIVPWVAIGSSLLAADVTITTVDGLNRPLAGVQIEVSCSGKTFRFRSASDGVARGTIDDNCEPGPADVAKPGYPSYSTGF